MKVENAVAFNPITITIETEGEVEVIKKWATRGYQNSPSGSIEDNMGGRLKRIG